MSNMAKSGAVAYGEAGSIASEVKLVTLVLYVRLTCDGVCLHLIV